MKLEGAHPLETRNGGSLFPSLSRGCLVPGSRRKRAGAGLCQCGQPGPYLASPPFMQRTIP
jgi:hypothetical protein